MAQTFCPSPCIVRETSTGLECATVYDEMFARREIAVLGPIDQAVAFDVCQHIRHLVGRDARAEIAVYVSSPGGEVAAGLAIYDELMAAPCPVRTVCMDTAASMGAVIFVAGDRRVMYPHAELMVHDPLISSGAGGSALSVQEMSRRLMDTRRVTNTILAERSGLTLKRVQQLTAKDTWIGAERAVELGFATEVAGARTAS